MSSYGKRPDEIPDFDRQTAIMLALPHAATIGRLENWRTGADEFVRVIEAAGYTVTTIDRSASPFSAAVSP